MDCDSAHEAISALLDDEDPGVDRRELERHIASCPGCTRWRAAAHEVTRSARLEPARAATIGSDDLVVSVLAGSRPPRRGGTLTWARAGLLAVAATQAWVTVPMLFSGRDHAAPAHVAHEVGAFAMALAVGFFVAAWKPERAHGMSTLVGAVAALLVITAVLDLFHGRTDYGDELPHLLAVVGWLLLVYLADATPSTTPYPSWSLTPVVRPRRGRRPVEGTGVTRRVPAKVQKETPAEPRRRPARRLATQGDCSRPPGTELGRRATMR